MSDLYQEAIDKEEVSLETKTEGEKRIVPPTGKTAVGYDKDKDKHYFIADKKESDGRKVVTIQYGYWNGNQTVPERVYFAVEEQDNFFVYTGEKEKSLEELTEDNKEPLHQRIFVNLWWTPIGKTFDDLKYIIPN